jgi:hypothetical protein
VFQPKPQKGICTDASWFHRTRVVVRSAAGVPILFHGAVLPSLHPAGGRDDRPDRPVHGDRDTAGLGTFYGGHARPGPPVLQRLALAERPARAHPRPADRGTTDGAGRGVDPRGGRHPLQAARQEGPRRVLAARRLPARTRDRAREPVGDRRNRCTPAVPAPPGLPAGPAAPAGRQGHRQPRRARQNPDRPARPRVPRAHPPRGVRRRLPRKTIAGPARPDRRDHSPAAQRGALRLRPAPRPANADAPRSRATDPAPRPRPPPPQPGTPPPSTGTGVPTRSRSPTCNACGTGRSTPARDA